MKLLSVVGCAVALSSTTSLSVFASWVLGNVVSFATTALWMSRTHTIRWSTLVPRWALLAGHGWSAAAHHALNLALSVPYFAMPIVANVTMTSEQAGYLYATWSVAAFVFVLPIALSTALFASGSAFTEDVIPQFRLSLRYSCSPAWFAVIAILFGDYVLRVFGKEYADQGHPRAHPAVRGRRGPGGQGPPRRPESADRAGVPEARFVWTLTVLELLGASIGGVVDDIEGLAAGWLLVVLLEIVVYGPMVLRTYRGKLEPSPDDEASRSASASEADLSGSPSIPL